MQQETLSLGVSLLLGDNDVHSAIIATLRPGTTSTENMDDGKMGRGGGDFTDTKLLKNENENGKHTKRRKCYTRNTKRREGNAEEREEKGTSLVLCWQRW